MPARGYSVTPRKKRKAAPARRTIADLEPIRSPRVSRDLARVAGQRPNTSRRKSTAQAKQRAEQRLRREVRREGAKVRQGRGVRSDSGNVLRGSTVVPGERRRAEAAAKLEAARLAKGKGGGGLRALLELSLIHI